MTIPDNIQPYADSIRQLIPVSELPDDALNELIRLARVLEVNKKDYLFRQGDRDAYSYYLLDGEIELEANNQIHNSITAGSDRARYPMAQLQPRQFSGRARVDSVVLKVERDALDRLLVLNQGREDRTDEFGEVSGSVELDVVDLEDEDSTDWMTRMLQSEIFSAMPTANIHKLFALLEPVEYKPGDLVIRQGEAGEHYYIIQEGRCEVLRQAKADGKAIKLAELRAGDSFGAEAMITQTTRNATVRMLTAGIIGRLSKDDFITLVQEPVLRTVSAGEAKELAAAGGNGRREFRVESDFPLAFQRAAKFVRRGTGASGIVTITEPGFVCRLGF